MAHITVRTAVLSSENIRNHPDDLSQAITIGTRTIPGKPGPKQALVRILFVSGEYNVVHLATASPIDQVARLGGLMYPGNCFLGEVFVAGEGSVFTEGDIVLSNCWEHDEHGDPVRVVGFDTPDGWYAEYVCVGEEYLLPAPLACGLRPQEMVALPLRAATAYGMWERATSALRCKGVAQPCLNVLGFGGGVSEAFLQLAVYHGHRGYYCSGSEQKRRHMEELGITSIDQAEFGGFAESGQVREFRKAILSMGGGKSMDIVCDMMRGPIFPAGIAALARHGVNISSGWQLSRDVSYNSAELSFGNKDLLHTHMAKRSDCVGSLGYYGTAFKKPLIHPEIFSFEQLPLAFERMRRRDLQGTPVIQIADRLPAILA